MPFLHRWLGNPVLSKVGKLFFRIPVGDFHCGMRAFRRDRIMALGLRTTGMEFASEMVVRSSLNKLRISEVPTTLRQDGRSRAPHLRTWRDGWRHLRFLLAFSPRWLLWYPAVALFAIGAVLMTWTAVDRPTLGGVGLGIHTMLVAATLVVLGVQLAAFAMLSQAYAAALKLLPRGRRLRAAEQTVLRWGLPGGVAAVAAGLGCFGVATLNWSAESFGALDPASTMQLPILGMLGIVLGVQSMMLSFALSLTSIDEI